VISIYDGDNDGIIDNMEVPFMMQDCYRAMNKNYAPKADDVILFSRVLAKNSSKLSYQDIEAFMLKTFSKEEPAQRQSQSIYSSSVSSNK